MVASLQRLCAAALVRAHMVLDPDASREEFYAYRNSAYEGTFERWAALVAELGVFGPEYSSSMFLSDLCSAMEPRYPWPPPDDEFATSWEMWCFCLARWIRNNDVYEVLSMPSCGLWDHRHAYAVSGRSAVPAFAEAAVCFTRLDEDWLCLLVRPENWNEPMFEAWAELVGGAGKLVSACQAAADADNHAAVHAVFRIARVRCGRAFWRIYEAREAYENTQNAYARLWEQAWRCKTV